MEAPSHPSIAWVIQFTGGCPCWVAPTAIGITYQVTNAQKFETEEQAIMETVKLRLPRDWSVVRIRA